jgi:TRAP transporter TAXI family solute receptor
MRRVLGILLAAACFARPACAADVAPVIISTGNPGAIYHPVGNALCRLYNLTADERTACRAVSSGGSVENIERVRRGEASLGISQTDVAYAAVRGDGRFSSAGAFAELRVLMALHTEAFSVVARADRPIAVFADLKGRRVSVGASGAGYAVTRDLLLAAYGWTLGDFASALPLGPSEQNAALCDDTVDAIMFAAGHPNGLIQEATLGCPTRLVEIAGPPLKRLLETHPYFVATVIPGGLYRGNPDDVATFGTRAQLVASASLPDETAYTIVKSVFTNFAAFQRMHGALSRLEASASVPRSVVVAPHPGALRYFREAGLGPEQKR